MTAERARFFLHLSPQSSGKTNFCILSTLILVVKAGKKKLPNM
jgi:hypothetical protein